MAKWPLRKKVNLEGCITRNIYFELTQDSIDCCDGQNTSSRGVNVPTYSFIQKQTASIDINLCINMKKKKRKKETTCEESMTGMHGSRKYPYCKWSNKRPLSNGGAKSQAAHTPGAYPGFRSIKRLGIFLLPPKWDAGFPLSIMSPVPIYTPGWREALWE